MRSPRRSSTDGLTRLGMCEHDFLIIGVKFEKQGKFVTKKSTRPVANNEEFCSTSVTHR